MTLFLGNSWSGCLSLLVSLIIYVLGLWSVSLLPPLVLLIDPFLATSRGKGVLDKGIPFPLICFFSVWSTFPEICRALRTMSIFSFICSVQLFNFPMLLSITSRICLVLKSNTKLHPCQSATWVQKFPLIALPPYLVPLQSKMFGI